MYKKFGSDLQGKIALITGASKGLGLGIAKVFALEGAKVALASRDVAQLELLAHEIRSEGGTCEAFALDLRDVSSIYSCVKEVEQKMGNIDILVNNAGMGNPIPAEKITEQDWDWMMDLNLKGTFFCCQAVGIRMLERGKGRIINISSQAS
ncbi:MAG TPA: SDR family oxidoreductase, partial [Sphaerochaeta sp.]|nr:SDR family oxidoreductase [Sphaerochaeta sp.]